MQDRTEGNKIVSVVFFKHNTSQLPPDQFCLLKLVLADKKTTMNQSSVTTMNSKNKIRAVLPVFLSWLFARPNSRISSSNKNLWFMAVELLWILSHTRANSRICSSNKNLWLYHPVFYQGYQHKSPFFKELLVESNRHLGSMSKSYTSSSERHT